MRNGRVNSLRLDYEMPEGGIKDRHNDVNGVNLYA